jgi:hypothetical protein
MISRGPGLLAVALSSPTRFPPKQVVSLSQSSSALPAGGGGRGAKLYNREKAWHSINHLILSGGGGGAGGEISLKGIFLYL